MVEPLWFVSPRDEDEVDGNTGQDHEAPVAGLLRAGDHRDNHDEDRGQQVEDREEDVHLDRAGQVRLLPSQPGQTQNGRADTQLKVGRRTEFNPNNPKFEVMSTHPGGESDVVDQRKDVRRGEVQHRQQRHDEDGRRRGEPLDLDHGENLRHLALAGAGVEQAR